MFKEGAGGCAEATSEANGNPLGAAYEILKKSGLPADNARFVSATANATRATEVGPNCAEAWNTLAFVRYRTNYSPCRKEGFDAAEAAAMRGLGGCHRGTRCSRRACSHTGGRCERTVSPAFDRVAGRGGAAFRR